MYSSVRWCLCAGRVCVVIGRVSCEAQLLLRLHRHCGGAGEAGDDVGANLVDHVRGEDEPEAAADGWLEGVGVVEGVLCGRLTWE